MTRVVYHFQGQSGRFTVWANCKQNSGCYFCPGIGLAICTNQFHLRKKRTRKPENGIIWNIPSGKTGLPFEVFHYSRKFSAGTTQKVVFHLLSNRIFQPRSHRKLSRSRHVLKPGKLRNSLPQHLETTP